MDEQGVELPARMVGEICIRGDFLFSGYHRFEEETRKRMHAGWYHTGDLGFLQEGELHVTGRKNDLIIVHGRNYYAHELEFIVNQVPGTHAGRNVAVGWFKPEVGSEEVVIIAEHPNPNAAAALQPPLGQAIKQALLDSAGLLVHDVHLVPPGWLAKTTSGKISRKDNLTRYLAEMGIHSSNT
jgi:acyl-CoA synthetase (AMP-forming)/AMP-acid ligase II